LLLYVPVAVNASGKPAATDGIAGVTAIEVSVGVEFELPLLHPASSPANIKATHKGRVFMVGAPRNNLDLFH
jgi:hypothetical protein